MKKCASEVVSTLILFIAVLLITTSIVIVFKNIANDTSDSFKFQSDLINNKLKSAISITNIFYNETNYNLYIYVKNIGSTKLNTEFFNLYIDGFYKTNFSITYPDNFSKNLTLLQPQMTSLIIKNINLSTGTHNVKVITEYSNSAEDLFNI